MCICHGVDVIYHAIYIDDEGMNMLEAKKSKHVVAPGINWLVVTRKCCTSLLIVFLLMPPPELMMLPLSGIQTRRPRKLATRKSSTLLSLDYVRCIEEA